MPKVVNISPEQEQKLTSDLVQTVYNPLLFVLYSYPWGKEGTRLVDEEGPDDWQIDILEEIGNGTMTLSDAIRIAVRSGHGIGKTALISWIVHWFMTTRPHCQVIVTANTKDQLTSKTWREIAKWHKMSKHSHWFEHTKAKFIRLGKDAQGNPFADTWFASLTVWNAAESEAFAGTHEKHVLIVFDEASAIHNVIWEVSEGAMTGKDKTGTKMHIAFGNPTRPDGKFADCFLGDRARWITREIDSRTVKMTDKVEIEAQKLAYGEDSDFFRVRVKGQTPRTGILQFIGADLVDMGLGKKVHYSTIERAPRIMGIDLARGGDDMTVIYKRQGIGYFPMIKMREPNSTIVEDKIAAQIMEWQPDAVFLDMGNIGAAVFDHLVNRLKLGKVTNIIGVWFGNLIPAAGREPGKPAYYNKRAQMWGDAKDFLKHGGGIPDDKDLRNDLMGPQYSYRDDNGTIQLESKKDMKKRLLPSPDCADAFVLTFAQPVEIFEREIEEHSVQAMTHTLRKKSKPKVQRRYKSTVGLREAA